MEDNNMSPSKFSDMIKYELDNISLTIYFWDFDTTNPRGVHMTLEWLVERAHTYRVVVTGEELAEHHELLSQLANVELIPSRNKAYVSARMYYVFEHARYGEIFSFLTHAVSSGAGAFDAVFVNGQEVRGKRIFFEAVLPFMPESAASEIQANVDFWLPASE